VSKFPRQGGLVLIHRPRLFQVVNALLNREEGATMTAIRFLQEVDGLTVPRQPYGQFAHPASVDLSEPRRGREPDQ